MAHSDGYVINERLLHLQLLFWRNPGQRYRTREIADRLQVSEDTVAKDLDDLSRTGLLPLVKEGWYWRLMEGARFELMPVKLNRAEGAALFLAARLLRGEGGPGQAVGGSASTRSNGAGSFLLRAGH